MKSIFRYDINGLRAIAVLSVVFFHFNESILPGGFVGVDIFFVISGFLMTKIITNKLMDNDFNIYLFYFSRAKRILPALSFLTIVCFIFGVFLLDSTGLYILAKHVISTLTFTSNIAYLMESGYFDPESSKKWLLHTWSLSVEWQFYILFPLILITFKKYLKNTKFKFAILIVTLLAFISSMVISQRYPDASYYLLPTRVWELLIGSIAFLYSSYLNNKNKKVFFRLSLFFIFASFLLIKKTYLWPSYITLIPCLGALGIIMSDYNQSRMLNNKIMQSIGSWSYSIYLWHWPVFVFLSYVEFEYVALLGIPISFFLGYLSYTIIERKTSDGNRCWLYLYVSVLFFSIAVIVSGYINDREGSVYYNKIEFDDYVWANMSSYANLLSFEKDEILIIGDSQAADLVNIYNSIHTTSIVSKRIWTECTLPFVDKDIRNDFFKNAHFSKVNPHLLIDCDLQMDLLEDFLLSNKVKNIYISFLWNEGFIDELEKSITSLRKLTNAKIYLIGRKNYLTKSSYEILMSLDEKNSNYSSDFLDYDTLRINSKLFELSKKLNVSYFDLKNILCDFSKKPECLVKLNGVLLFYDIAHFTPSASKMLALEHIKEIDNLDLN